MWGDGGRGRRRADVHLLGKVGNKVISCEGGRRQRGERREHEEQFSGVGGGGGDFGPEGRFSC